MQGGAGMLALVSMSPGQVWDLQDGVAQIDELAVKMQLKSKRSQVFIGIFTLVSLALAVFGNVNFIQTQRTREVFKAIGNANEARIKAGANVASAEAYIAALRRIDVDYAKKELRPAFSAYVDGLEEGLELTKAGKSTSNADAKVKAAYDELNEIARRYD
jgi:hypothetical protein